MPNLLNLNTVSKLFILRTKLMMNINGFQQSASNRVEIRMTDDELRKAASVAFCEICSRTFANKNAFHLHQVKTHSCIRGEVDLALFHRKRVTSEVAKHYFCPVIGCQYNNGRSFKAYKLLHQHFLKVHGEKRFRCDKCKTAKFSLQRDLLYHQRKRCLLRERISIQTSTLAGMKSDYPEIERHSEKLLTINDNRNMVSTASDNKVRNVIFISVNVVQANRIPSFRQIRPKLNFRLTKSSQTDCVEYYNRPVMRRHTGSQTTQWSPCELSTLALHKYNDSHCQTHIANGVEFGTQIYPEDVASGDLHVKHAKTHNDFEFEDIWRHIETQTSTFTANDALTQTAIDFMDSASMTDWDLLI
ncbi:ATM interactor [Dirofilaria immitis]